MTGLPKNHDPDLLVDFQTSDDAAVYRLNSEIAIITTADYITPPVDDPYLFGQIAAANAISDVYAMGGRPISCLNLAGFPSSRLKPEILHQIVAGALSKITEADAVLAGGHTTDDEEPKFGLCVTGVVHPERYWRNIGAQPGDTLILTKPIGSGVLFNANLKQQVPQNAIDECIRIITALNKNAAKVMMGGYDIHAVTDVTGFGLAGHGLEMARGSGVTMKINVDNVPVMSKALDMYKAGVSTGVNKSNRSVVAGYMRFDTNLPAWHEEIFLDPQTSGGLLTALPAEQGNSLLTKLHEAGVDHARIIGDVATLDGSNYLLFK